MSKHNNVNPDHYKVRGRERQGEDVIHEVERREARRLQQGAHTQENVGISNRMSPDEETRDAAKHPPLDTNAPPPRDAAGRVGEEPLEGDTARQTSIKAGSRSMAQKEAGTRHPDDPAPPSRKVSGAFGREGQDTE